MNSLNIFKDIKLFEFNIHNVRLDTISKIIIRNSIQQQYDEFVNYIKEPLENNQLESLGNYQYYHYIKGIFSTNPLEHCLINYYLNKNNPTSSSNKYNSSGLIAYLLLVGFTANANFIKQQVLNLNPDYRFDLYECYLMKLQKN
jgi:hypothetical protein